MNFVWTMDIDGMVFKDQVIISYSPMHFRLLFFRQKNARGQILHNELLDYRRMAIFGKQCAVELSGVAPNI